MGPALPRGAPLCAPSGFRLQEGGGEQGEGPRCSSPCGRFFQGKRTLLPLRKAEKKTVIFPYDPTIQASEMRNVVRTAGEAATGTGPRGRQRRQRGHHAGQATVAHSTSPIPGQVREIMGTLPVLLLLLVLCGLDWALYSTFDTIRHHSFLQYSFHSEPAPQETSPWGAPTPVQPSRPNSSSFVTCFWVSAPPCPPQDHIPALQPDSCYWGPRSPTTFISSIGRG